MAFQKAKREQIYPKVALIGASGSGKSYSALRLATGAVKKMGKGKKIYYIDSEGGRGKYYANEFDYEYASIEAPYTTEKYINLIEEATSQSDCGVLIVDSTSHCWAGKGGILEQHSNMPGNSYTNWAKLTPKYNKFVDTILLSPAFIICCVRGKDEYVMEEKNGKQVPKKIGLGGEIRQNFEYEMSVAFNIDQTNHVAMATKDNTHLFDDRYDVLTEKDGESLYDWANTGDKPAPKPKVDDVPIVKETETLREVNTKIANMAKEKATVSAEVKATVKTILAKYHTSGNPNKIEDIEQSKKCLEEINNIKTGDK